MTRRLEMGIPFVNKGKVTIAKGAKEPVVFELTKFASGGNIAISTGVFFLNQYEPESSARVSLEIAKLTTARPNNFGVITGRGNVKAAGTLDLKTPSSYKPPIGAKFVVVSGGGVAGTLTGTFTLGKGVCLPQDGAGVGYTPTYAEKELTLTVANGVAGC